MMPDFHDGSQLPGTGLLSEAEADAVDQADVDDAGSSDPDAPYGINPNTGKPYRKSPEERAAFGQAMAEARRTASARGASTDRRSSAPGRRRPSPARTPQAPRKAPAAPKVVIVPERLDGARVIIGIGSALVGAAGRWVHPSFAYDALAINLHGGALAMGLAETANDVPQLAAWLESFGKVGGPWGPVIMAALPLLAQIGANHGVRAPLDMFGITTLSPDELLEAAAPDTYAAVLAQREAQAQAQAEANSAVPDAA